MYFRCDYEFYGTTCPSSASSFGAMHSGRSSSSLVLTVSALVGSHARYQYTVTEPLGGVSRIVELPDSRRRIGTVLSFFYSILIRLSSFAACVCLFLTIARFTITLPVPVSDIPYIQLLQTVVAHPRG